ncbi:olfactory receptor 1-like [Boleophthalmus pectinirostris]|uniref:olfactory receptor 1-like n=1 Tax=Boleophthalmus pectinirostris TaxID=150288 RepID=UPI000A1C3BE2|nr:olfactory receptor 1-like [Boleophthalmus pectinirostris]
MANLSVHLDMLLLEGVPVSPGSAPLAFALLLVMYVFIVVSHVGLVLLICVERSLRTPMYLLFCNMSLNDVFGASVVIPRLLQDLLTPSGTRHISYSLCVLQAFCAHFHASVVHTVLMAMALDRYVAIVKPLRYSLIMTHRAVLYLSLSLWGVCFVMVLILILLSVRLSRCRNYVSHPFCDNASLFKLSCESVLINNVYGLFYTVVLLGSSIGSVAVTYMRIAVVCMTRRSGSLNRRALQTCASHLASYLLLLVSGSILIILHRFPSLDQHRKMASILFHVVPPALNTVIYGLQIREVRDRISRIWTRTHQGTSRRQLIPVYTKTTRSETLKYFSSAFNTIIPQQLICKLHKLGLSTSLFNWLLDFLSQRLQAEHVGKNTSNTISDETLYRKEDDLLTTWCRDNNLQLNVSKIKEIVVDFQRGHTQHQTLTINGAVVERVSSTTFLGVHISEDSWTTALVKKAQQRLYYLQKLKRTRASPPS